MPAHAKTWLAIATMIAVLAACTSEDPATNDAANDTSHAHDDSASTSEDTTNDTSHDHDTASTSEDATTTDTSHDHDTTPEDSHATHEDTHADTHDPMDMSDNDMLVGPGDHRGECHPGLCGANDEGECVPVPNTVDGWHTCAIPQAERTACVAEPGSPFEDECCTSADCTTSTGGGCFDANRWYCGGAAPIDHNACLYDECAADADCAAQPNGACVPSGAWGEERARCVYSECLFDADCSDRAGGQCRPFFDPCRGRLTAFYCTYDDSTCRADADCVTSSLTYCAPGDNGNTQCTEWFPPP